MPKIIIDHRESRQIIKELAKRDLDIDTKQLLTADFIINTRTIDGKIQSVGIERKTQSDFLNSIIDRRLLNQLIILKENFDLPILILEGEENIYAMRNFHPNSIRGMLTTIALDFQIPIIPTKNYKDTAAFLENIAKRLEKSRKPISLLTKTKPVATKELQEYIIASLPGIGPTISKNLLKEFRTIKNIMNADEKDLQKVNKIGKIKAGEIKKIIEELYQQD
jgi:Fanconi anemia group M protein